MATSLSDQRLASYLVVHNPQHKPDKYVCDWGVQNRNPVLGSKHVISFSKLVNDSR